uniref:Caerulein precursor fragment B4 n=1 Tax=Xenopus borealis TaxID=8354 RepID=CPFB4_XENBO|nr:RecName: Full=Caerulein precursor fragment B4; Short=CPF-B4 [Xenopus borealis]
GLLTNVLGFLKKAGKGVLSGLLPL